MFLLNPQGLAYLYLKIIWGKFVLKLFNVKHFNSTHILGLL